MDLRCFLRSWWMEARHIPADLRQSMTSLVYKTRKTRATLFQPIRCKTKINHNLVARVFPRFRQFGCVHFDFSLALQSIFFLLIGCRDYFDFSFTTLSQKALHPKFQGLNMNKTGKCHPNSTRERNSQTEQKSSGKSSFHVIALLLIS